MNVHLIKWVESMKKLIISTILLALACGVLPALAAIDTDRLLSEDYLRNAGYSPEAIRMVNIKRYDPYSPYVEPKRETNLIKRFVQYMDPLAESGRFGTGIIDPRLDMPSKL